MTPVAGTITTASLIAALGDPPRRREAGRALAQMLGAEDLLLFARDPVLGRLLAAPELAQTLPQGRRWRAFVEECARTADEGDGAIQVAELPYPEEGVMRTVTALAAVDQTVLVLIGGAPDRARLAELRQVLPLLGSIVGSEWRALAAAGRADLAEASESRARELADSLDAARQELERALTRARRAEETAARRAARLELLAEENARLHRQAQDAVRLRDAVMTAAAHDLKTPLASMKGYAQLLKRRARRGSIESEALERGLAQIEASTDRMSSMVDELADLARLQMGEPLVLRREATNLVEVARRVVAAHAESKGQCRLRLEAAESEVVGEWDAGRLERVLDNLISNAVKYSPQGGDVVVRVGRELGAGEGDGDGSDGWAVLAIQDDGIGIPEGDLPHIFDRFHRASNVSREISGSGVGLASAKQIVEQHGGTIAAESREGEGSCFTLRLPL